METAGGKEVGTLYLRVVPVLDQTAMAGVAQQAQAGMGGGRGIGGPGAVSPGAGAAMAQARYGMAGGPMLGAGGFGFGGGGGGGGAPGAMPPPLPLPSPGGASYQPGGGGGGGGSSSNFGSRRAAMQAMFGAWEVGRAYSAYEESFSPMNTRTGLQAAYAAKKAADTAMSGLLGGPMGSVLRFRESVMRSSPGAAVMMGAFGVAGMAISGLGDRTPIADAENAIFQAEQSQKDVSAGAERMVRSRKTDTDTEGLRDEMGSLEQARTPLGSRLRQIRLRSSGAARKLRGELENMRDRIAAEPDPREAARMRKDMTAAEASGWRNVNAQVELGWAQDDEARRQDADEREQVGNDVVRRLRRRDADVSGSAARTRGIRARMRGDDLGGIGANLDAARIQIKAREDLTPGQKGTFYEEAEANAASDRKSAIQSNSMRLNAATRQAEWAEMRNRISPGGSYAAANLRAHAQQIYDTANDESIFLGGTGRGAEATQRRRLGAAQLGNLYNSITADLSGFEGSARTASGGGEIKDLLRQIRDNTNSLKGGTDSGGGGMQ